MKNTNKKLILGAWKTEIIAQKLSTTRHQFVIEPISLLALLQVPHEEKSQREGWRAWNDATRL